MRLFVAIYPPKDHLDYMRDMLRRFDKQKRNLVKVPIDQLHLTVKFLGPKVSEESKDIIADELISHAGTYTKPIIEIAGMSFGFPKQFFPTILMTKVKSKNDTLNSLVDEVHQSVKSLKLRDTKKWKGRYPYNHHITIARLKENATKSNAKLLYSHTQNLPDVQKPKPFEATEMFLVKSETDGNTTSPRYTRLERISL